MRPVFASAVLGSSRCPTLPSAHGVDSLLCLSTCRRAHGPSHTDRRTRTPPSITSRRKPPPQTSITWCSPTLSFSIRPIQRPWIDVRLDRQPPQFIKKSEWPTAPVSTLAIRGRQLGVGVNALVVCPSCARGAPPRYHNRSIQGPMDLNQGPVGSAETTVMQFGWDRG